MLSLPIVEVARARGDRTGSFSLLRQSLDARLELFIRQAIDDPSVDGTTRISLLQKNKAT